MELETLNDLWKIWWVTMFVVGVSLWLLAMFIWSK